MKQRKRLSKKRLYVNGGDWTPQGAVENQFGMEAGSVDAQGNQPNYSQQGMPLAGAISAGGSAISGAAQLYESANPEKANVGAHALKGAGAGAASGALMGTFLLPGIGTALGAGIGAGVGFIGGTVGGFIEKGQMTKDAKAKVDAEIRRSGMSNALKNYRPETTVNYGDTFAYGGPKKKQVPDFVTSDKEEYNRRLQAYNDSLGLYNKYPAIEGYPTTLEQETSDIKRSMPGAEKAWTNYATAIKNTIQPSKIKYHNSGTVIVNPETNEVIQKPTENGLVLKDNKGKEQWMTYRTLLYDKPEQKVIYKPKPTIKDLQDNPGYVSVWDNGKRIQTSMPKKSAIEQGYQYAFGGYSNRDSGTLSRSFDNDQGFVSGGVKQRTLISKYNNPNHAGGMLTRYEGNTHEDGGIPIGANDEVEGGETKWQDYIFSDRLYLPNKKMTFASVSDKIAKKAEIRPADKITKDTTEREMNGLMALQEKIRQDNGLTDNNQSQDMRTISANGGPLNRQQLPMQTQGMNPMLMQQLQAQMAGGMQTPLERGTDEYDQEVMPMDINAMAPPQNTEGNDNFQNPDLQLAQRLKAQGYSDNQIMQVLQGERESVYPGALPSSPTANQMPFDPTQAGMLNAEMPSVERPEMKEIGNTAKPQGPEYRAWIAKNKTKLMDKYNLSTLSTKELEKSDPAILDKIRREYVSQHKREIKKEIENHAVATEDLKDVYAFGGYQRPIDNNLPFNNNNPASKGIYAYGGVLPDDSPSRLRVGSQMSLADQRALARKDVLSLQQRDLLNNQNSIDSSFYRGEGLREKDVNYMMGKNYIPNLIDNKFMVGPKMSNAEMLRESKLPPAGTFAYGGDLFGGRTMHYAGGGIPPTEEQYLTDGEKARLKYQQTLLPEQQYKILPDNNPNSFKGPNFIEQTRDAYDNNNGMEGWQKRDLDKMYANINNNKGGMSGIYGWGEAGAKGMIGKPSVIQKNASVAQGSTSVNTNPRNTKARVSKNGTTPSGREDMVPMQPLPPSLNMTYNAQEWVDDGNGSIRLDKQGPKSFNQSDVEASKVSFDAANRMRLAKPRNETAKPSNYKDNNKDFQDSPINNKGKYNDYLNMLPGYLAGNIGYIDQLLSKKATPQQIAYDRITPEQVNYEPQRVDARQNANLSRSIIAANANQGTSRGQQLNNTLAGNVAVNQGLGQQLDQSYMQEGNYNAGVRGNANQMNAQIQMREMEARAREKDATDQYNQEKRTHALTGIGQNTMGFSRDVLQQNMQDKIVKNWLFTKDYKATKDGLFFVFPDGSYMDKQNRRYDVNGNPLGTVKV